MCFPFFPSVECIHDIL
ncbi:hypothetical protein CGLO_17991 [Colletotrichum gloeosporioides Cg-14]|uniref:Uncharacterized protein n=1 Tax=Colletotrichum gloeosporioides (strain Cg-14) TaxID=1237896 RepID=T0L546_COLGC|nr:hypothetical protein CGLO_17991 [Colletotrichum gloeosporioides Cg-14]